MSHMEKFVETGKERQASVKSFEEEKKSQWEASAANLSTDQRNRVRLIFMAVDNGGDGNGTVEKAELEFLDKKGKMFDKIDSSSTGHVTSEAFEVGQCMHARAEHECPNAWLPRGGIHETPQACR